jgi:hypothetical protein
VRAISAYAKAGFRGELHVDVYDGPMVPVLMIFRG